MGKQKWGYMITPDCPVHYPNVDEMHCAIFHKQPEDPDLYFAPTTNNNKKYYYRPEGVRVRGT